MADTKVTLSGLTLDNPVIPASGTFGFGREFAALYDLRMLGSIALKGTTKEPRYGNPTPRIAECPAGMINAVGLQNPGIHRVLEEELPFLEQHFGKPVVLNIGGFSLEEFAYCCALADKEDTVGIIELNISCPNLHAGGVNFGQTPDTAAQAVRAARRATKKPLYVKLTPNVSDIVAIAKACEQEGADGISLINTLLGMRIDLKTRRPVLANTMGGVSGPCVYPVALRMVYQVSAAVSVPVIGMGGISTANDVIEMMLAGATAVEVGAANLVNPYACRDIIDGLPAAMERYHITHLSDIIGGAH